MLMNERLIRLFMGFPVRAPWGFWGVSGDTPAPPSARPRLFMGFPVRAPWGFWGVSGDTPAPPSADVFVFGGHPRPHGLPRGLLLLAGLTALFAVSAAAPGAAQQQEAPIKSRLSPRAWVKIMYPCRFVMADVNE